MIEGCQLSGRAGHRVPRIEVVGRAVELTEGALADLLNTRGIAGVASEPRPSSSRKGLPGQARRRPHHAHEPATGWTVAARARADGGMWPPFSAANSRSTATRGHARLSAKSLDAVRAGGDPREGRHARGDGPRGSAATAESTCCTDAAVIAPRGTPALKRSAKDLRPWTSGDEVLRLRSGRRRSNWPANDARERNAVTRS